MKWKNRETVNEKTRFTVSFLTPCASSGRTKQHASTPRCVRCLYIYCYCKSDIGLLSICSLQIFSLNMKVIVVDDVVEV